MAASVPSTVATVADSKAMRSVTQADSSRALSLSNSAYHRVDQPPQTVTSRGPVREALRQLENEGLVMSFPYRGAVVLGVSDDEVQEVLIPIRLTLERYSFVHALEQMTDEDFAELGKQIWLMEQAAHANDLARHVEADLRFHEIVIAASGQTHTVQIWRTIWPRIRAYFYRYGRGRDLVQMVDEHRELLAALQSREPKSVLEVLERHISVPVPNGAAPAAGKGRSRSKAGK